jgi:YihY family inner membrane protein
VHTKRNDVFHHASAISFNLIICSIPFTLLLISILGYILSYQAAYNQILRYAHQVFPSFTYQSTASDALHGMVTLKAILAPLIGHRQVFGALGIIILIIFSMGLFHTIKHVIFEIFEFRDHKHLVMQWVHNFFTFGLIGGILVFLAIAISFFSVVSLQSLHLAFTTKVFGSTGFHTFLHHIFPLVFILLIFYLLFRHISETRLKRSVALVGAVSFTVLFGAAKVLISVYLNHAFFGYHLYYQGYAVIVVFGFWAFYSALLFVISAVIARSYQDIFLKKQPLHENPITEIS